MCRPPFLFLPLHMRDVHCFYRVSPGNIELRSWTSSLQLFLLRLPSFLHSCYSFRLAIHLTGNCVRSCFESFCFAILCVFRSYYESFCFAILRVFRSYYESFCSASLRVFRSYYESFCSASLCLERCRLESCCFLYRLREPQKRQRWKSG